VGVATTVAAAAMVAAPELTAASVQAGLVVGMREIGRILVAAQ